MTAMLLLLSMVLVKLQHQYKHFLSDFKIWNQKPHAKEWLFSRKHWKTFIRQKRLFPMGTLYYFDQQSSKGKKGTIVAMIAGTKAQIVIAIIEKYRLNYEIQFLR
jgi:hypothetical protein